MLVLISFGFDETFGLVLWIFKTSSFGHFHKNQFNLIQSSITSQYTQLN
jgi:hypothetical protein